MVEVVFLEYRE